MTFGSNFACAASVDFGCPARASKHVRFGECTIRRFLSTVDNPRKVERARVPNYSWPPEIQGLNSAREHRRAHMKAVLWHEQVVLDNSDQALIGGDACVLELTLSKRSASEVMAAAAKVQKRVRRLMLDSGCGIDLIGMHDLSVEERKLVSAYQELLLRTANGKTSTKGLARLKVDGIAELIEAYVLENTPSLLSLGKRCMEDGYRFSWDPYQIPRLFDPKGREIKLELINNIPYLLPTETQIVSANTGHHKFYSAFPAPIVVHEKVVAAGSDDENDLIAEFPSLAQDGDDPVDIGEPASSSHVPVAKAKAKAKVKAKAKAAPKAESSHPPVVERDLRAEAKSLKHLMTHLPKNPYCDACQRAKMVNVKSFRGDGIEGYDFTKFGEHITLDTMVLHGLTNRGINGETDAIVFYDFGTGWIDAVPVKNRTNAETLRAFREVIGDLKEVNSFSFDTEREYAPPSVQEMYCDKAREFVSTCRNVGIKVTHSTPGMPRTNAMAEAKVKLVLQGARVALRQAGLEAKFWPYAVRHFCMAANLTIEKGESAFKKRFESDRFAGQFIPFGCLVDYFPTPSRRDIKRTTADGLKLNVCEADALAAASSGSEDDCESEPDSDVVKMQELLDSGVDEDEALKFFAEIEGRPPRCHGMSLPAESSDEAGKEEWFASDEFDPEALDELDNSERLPDDDIPDITHDGTGRTQTFQPRGKFSPTSRPGVFLGYHCEVGSKWNGDYIVADLEDFKQNLSKPGVQQVKRVYLAPSEKYTFPLLPIYEKRTRSLCLDDPAMLDSDTRVEPSGGPDEPEKFDFNEGRADGIQDKDNADDPQGDVEPSHGATVDYWEHDESSGVWTYHVVAPRKAMVQPGATPGSLGVAPDIRKLSNVRISYVKYPGGSPVEIREEHYALGKTRLMKLWTGKVLFFEHGKVPEKRAARLSTYKKHGVLGLDGELPYKQEAERSERKYKGTRKPNSIDSETWRSMSRPEREGYVEAELREAERNAMSKNDPHDAGPVKIEYDDGYESPAFKGEKDGWIHDTKHGVIIRHHPLSRKAKFEPESLKNCPVPTCMLSDTRITLVQTEGAEFALHDSWRDPKHKTLPFHWTGRTIFMLRDHDAPRVKISPSKPGMFQPSELEDEERSYFLRSSSRVVVPAKGRSSIETGLRVRPPKGVWGRFRPIDKKDSTHPCLEVCPGIISEDHESDNLIIEVANSSESDLIIEPGDSVAVVQFFSGIVCVAEVGDVSAPVSTNLGSDYVACSASPSIASKPADVPQMPLRSQPYQHRNGDTTVFWYSACVARPVDRKERAINAKAMASLDKEWNKLIGQKCWDYASVREWREVAAEADKQGIKAHVGRIFDICVEKNSELPEGDPNRKYKGRVVFEGCHVKDEHNNWAIFSEITSCPATMEAGKAADAFGLLPGHAIEVADGESAYTQAKLEGPPTWVRLPKDRWPPEWHGKYVDPVVRLVLALYGHPDAGGFWEQHCERALKSVGYIQVPEWKSVFMHPKLGVMLVVYVDDFKMAGPKENLSKAWDLVKSKIKMEEAAPIKRYLGCEHVQFEHTVSGVFDPRMKWAQDEKPKKEAPDLMFGKDELLLSEFKFNPCKIRMIKYDMRSFMEQCIDRYRELCGTKYKASLRHVDTPFLDESRPEFDANPDRPAVNALLGHPNTGAPALTSGVLGDCAAAVLMKVLYGARMGRYDLIRPVQALASLITKWSDLCDRKLHRLMCYIYSTLDLSLYGWIGDSPDLLELVLYCDADLAGDRTDSKSTSGIFMCLLGPRSFMPLNAVSKKQTSVSKSTPEAEIVSMDHAIYKLGLPAMTLWERLLDRKITLRVMEDNEAAIRVIVTGHNPNMRHMSRTQRIDVSALNERYHAEDFRFVTCPSQFEAGDILTKACTDSRVWSRNLMSIGHFRKGTLISSGMLNAVPALSGSVMSPEGPCPTRGVHFAHGSMRQPFNKIVSHCVENEIEIFQVSRDESQQAVVSLFDIGGNYNGCGLRNVRVMKVFPGKLKKPVVLSARVPQSTSVCLICPQVENKSLTAIAVSEQGGWKATKAMMSQITADSRKYLALASVCAESGAIPVVVCKKGNVVWPKVEVREWCESWGLNAIKMCSCKFGFDFHAWIGNLHVTTEFFPVLMNRFGCKHKKQSSVPISPSYDRIIELVSSAAAAGSSSQ